MSCNRPFLLITTSVLALAIPFMIGTAHAEPLASAVESALKNHPSVEAAEANRDAYAQERREQWANYFPNLNVRGTGGRVYGDNSTSRGLTVTRGAAYSYLWEGAVTLTQPLFDGFETTNRVDAAEMRQDSADFNIVDVRENLSLRMVMSYLDVLRSRESLDKISKHAKKIEDYQKRIQKMVDEGAADEAMVVQARDIAAQLESTVADIKGQLQAANIEYMELTGHLPEDEMEMPVPRFDLVPETADDAASYAKEKHPTLQAASYTERALAYDAESEKRFYYPDINGELSYLERDQRDEIGGEAIDAKAVVRLNWDLSLAGGQLAKARKAEQRHYEGKAQYAEKEREIERAVRTAYSDLEVATRQLEILEDRVKINEKLLKNYEAQFEGARVNLLQLLQADNALFNAKLGQMNAEYRKRASAFAILASMGRLQESLNLVLVKGDGN